LGLCALELDAKDNGSSHREALRQGLIALDEADELGGKQMDAREPTDVRTTAAGHVTPALDRSSDSPVESIQAVQAYYAFAEERLTYACLGMPATSLAFYGLGRTFVLPGAQVANAAGKAALLQRVALAIAPQNVLACNELGVLFAQYGHLEQAEKLFEQCVATNATPESWRNLSVVYARQGEHDASLAALKSSETLAAKNSIRPVSNPDASTAAAPAANSAKDDSDSKRPTSFFARFSKSANPANLFRR
jgi:hypothetical protein